MCFDERTSSPKDFITRHLEEGHEPSTGVSVTIAFFFRVKVESLREFLFARDLLSRIRHGN